MRDVTPHYYMGSVTYGMVQTATRKEISMNLVDKYKHHPSQWLWEYLRTQYDIVRCGINADLASDNDLDAVTNILGNAIPSRFIDRRNTPDVDIDIIGRGDTVR
jgi:hypothetical protein